MLLSIIEKVGFVWADVSGLNPNVMYELGAAHARDRQGIVVVQAEEGPTPTQIEIPANIGHDLVATYSPTEEGWPALNALALAVIVAAMRSACERAGKHRVGREQVKELLAEAAERAAEGLPEAPE